MQVSSVALGVNTIENCRPEQLASSKKGRRPAAPLSERIVCSDSF